MPLDFDTLRGILPLQSLLRGNFIVLSSQEADALMNIWNGQSDPFGRKILPRGINSAIVASLVDKGLLETDKPNSSIVVLTGKAREIVKRKILQETSAFDRKAGVRTASTNEPARSWLKRAVRYGR
jgi:DNA-binding MarR family transcriptional regulator